jgi:hypothetical protein
METQSSTKHVNPVVRQLASLKLLSRLLGHELHAQGGSKSVTLTREEVSEIQTTVDLFIEEITRRQSQAPSAPIASVVASEPHLVASRN